VNTCDEGHEAIAYNGRHCPVCLEQEAVEQLEREKERLEGEVDDVTEQLNAYMEAHP
jgi:hypothetical protein